jgi:uncharacterized membrane protein (DUF485 family)
MDDRTIRKIQGSAAYRELERKRTAFSWTLCAIMLIIYYGFILLVAFVPSWLAQPLGNSVITLGFPLGLGVIVSAIGLTGIYVWRANGRFDRLTREIVEATR